MSVGNTKDKGNNFGNNFPFQIAMLKLLGTISTNTSGSGQDYELITYNYKANKNGAGYSTGNLITRTQIVFVPTGNIISTLWFNQSTGLTIAPPPIADIDAVLPATAVTVNNLPTVLGQALMINSLAVTIASDQSAIPVTNPNLDVALSTRNAEATQLLIKALLTTIDGDTSNLDVLLSTRASEVTLASLLTCCGLKANEATQLLIQALLTTIDGDTSNLDVLLSTRNAEVTQLLVKTAVEGINTKLTTVARVPSAVNVTAGVGGTTTAGVRSCTLWFRGANGSVGGVPVPNNAIMTFNAGAEEDTLNGIAYVRPTTGEARIIITYTT